MKHDLRRILTFALIAGSVLVLTEVNSSHAYEVDDFTERNHPRKDALEVMDREINQILDRAARVANEESTRYCSKAHLRQEILRWIRPDPEGILEIWANRTAKLQTTHTRYKNSIYGDISILDAPALWMVGIGRSYRLAGHMSGTDKIGHFFMQGLDYYDRVQEGKEIERVMAEDHGEEGLWGKKMTGVKSYADMSANYSGYLFWNSLTYGDQHYFKCEIGRGWVKTRTFTWADYVNDSWDEGTNCSEMKPLIQAKVDHRLHQMGMNCPVEPAKCASLAKLDKAKLFLSPKCLEAASSGFSEKTRF